jgi:hypothetical protein
MQLALHPPPPTLSFYHDNLFCPSCVAYYAFHHLAQLLKWRRIGFLHKYVPVLLLQKVMIRKGRFLFAHIFFLKWALNCHCNVPISDITALIALLQTYFSRLAGNLAFPLKLWIDVPSQLVGDHQPLVDWHPLPRNEATNQFKSIPSIWSRQKIGIKSSCSQLVFWPFGLCPWPVGSSTTHSSLCWVTLWRRFTTNGLWWCTRGRGVCCCQRLQRWYVRLSVEQHKQDWKSKQNSY